MAYFSHVETRLDTAVARVTGITDLAIHSVGDSARLFVTTALGTGLSVRSLQPGLAVLDHMVLPAAATLGSAARLGFLEVAGQPMVAVIGRADGGLRAFDLSDTGLPGAVHLLSGTGDAALTALDAVTVAGRSFVVAGVQGSTGLACWEVGPAGTLLRRSPDPDPDSAAAPNGLHTADLAIITVGAARLVLSISATANTITCHSLSDRGALVQQSRLGAAEGLGIAAPTALQTVDLLGEAYALVAAAGSSSISVIRLAESGRMAVTDHVIDCRDTRFQAVSVLEVVTVGDRVYVLAGGGDDGLSLMQLLPGGRLLHLDVVADTAQTVLANLSALTAHWTGSRIDLFAAGTAKPGISHFSIDPGPLAPVMQGTAAADTLRGDARGDLILGGDGADLIEGNAGDDILIDGAGQDTLRGGAGADTFVLTADGTVDVVHDFQPGLDRFDLSGWGMLRDVSQFQFWSNAIGATIRFGTEQISLVTMDRSPLTLAMLQNADCLNLTHIPVFLTEPDPPTTGGPGNDTLTGGAGDDTLRGGAGDDSLTGAGGADDLAGQDGDDRLSGGTGADTLTGGAGDDSLTGGAGNDLLIGGAGADAMDGGDGTDTASYADATGPLFADLQIPAFNSGIARGDLLTGIENLTGSAFNDNLRGEYGANQLVGGAGNDVLIGRQGDDTLHGGDGDDVLLGGSGLDVLTGGAGRDRAQYSQALTTVTVDLRAPGLNTFEAAGDRYDGIEDLAGGAFGDRLYGDDGVNRIYGRDGMDRMYGRGGDDELNGGSGPDRLDGGNGNDTLRGSADADTFVFTAGVDIVQDLRLADGDRIEVHRTLTGGRALTGDQLLEFARPSGAHLVFDFGDGHRLTLLNTAQTAGLADALFTY